MASTRAKWALAAGALVVVVAAFLVAKGSGGGSSTTSATAPATTPSASSSTAPGAPPGGPPAAATGIVTVDGGKPVGGVKTLTYSKGDPVRIVVHSDTAEEVHVHGYDIKKHVPADSSVTFAFKATIDGRFVIELERAGTQIATLQVNP